jgi:hypothetical protein
MEEYSNRTATVQDRPKGYSTLEELQAHGSEPDPEVEKMLAELSDEQPAPSGELKAEPIDSSAHVDAVSEDEVDAAIDRLDAIDRAYDERASRDAELDSLRKHISEYRKRERRWRERTQESNAAFAEASSRIARAKKIADGGLPPEATTWTPADVRKYRTMIRQRRSRDKLRKEAPAPVTVSTSFEPLSKAELRKRAVALKVWFDSGHRAARKLKGQAREILADLMVLREARAALGHDPSHREFANRLSVTLGTTVTRSQAQHRRERLRNLERDGYAWEGWA